LVLIRLRDCISDLIPRQCIGCLKILLGPLTVGLIKQGRDFFFFRGSKAETCSSFWINGCWPVGPLGGSFWTNLICFVYARMHLVAGGQSMSIFVDGSMSLRRCIVTSPSHPWIRPEGQMLMHSKCGSIAIVTFLVLSGSISWIRCQEISTSSVT
jgi:hypothetical protein